MPPLDNSSTISDSQYGGSLRLSSDKLGHVALGKRTFDGRCRQGEEKHRSNAHEDAPTTKINGFKIYGLDVRAPIGPVMPGGFAERRLWPAKQDHRSSPIDIL